MTHPQGPVTVIGAGLAGSLVSLALARRGAQVELIAPAGREADPASEGLSAAPPPSGAEAAAATAVSYGSVAGPAAAARWQELERLHGPLGWHSSAVVLHGLGPSSAQRPAGNPPRPTARGPLQALLERLPLLPAPLPFSRVDGPSLATGLRGALERAGVRRIEQRVLSLQPLPRARWQLGLADGPQLERGRVVLAAGASCGALWPDLPSRLRCSWAGVLAQTRLHGESRWLAAVRRGWMVFPMQLQRPALERAGRTDDGRNWVVDLGLAPWGQGLLAGQISWIRPGGAEADASAMPDAAFLEATLRAELGRLDPPLADLEARFRLVAVSYCDDGVPLSGPLAPGLWVLAGVSNAYSHLPALAEALASELLG